jgi:hypothetical protein
MVILYVKNVRRQRLKDYCVVQRNFLDITGSTYFSVFNYLENGVENLKSVNIILFRS